MHKNKRKGSKSPRSLTASRESSPTRTLGSSTSLGNAPSVGPRDEKSLGGVAESATTLGFKDESLDLFTRCEVDAPATQGMNLPSTSTHPQNSSVGSSQPKTRSKVSRKSEIFDTSVAKKKKLERSLVQGSTEGSTVDREVENKKHSKETHQLVQLNNRLADCIQNVGQLAREGKELRKALEERRNSVSSETDSQRAFLEHEIGTLRFTLTETTKLAAQANSKAHNAVKNVERLKKIRATLNERLSEAQQRAKHLESENCNLKAESLEAGASQKRIRVELEEKRNQLAVTENDLNSAAVDNAQLKHELQILRNEVHLMMDEREKDLAELKALQEGENTKDRQGPLADAEVSLQKRIEEFRQVYEVRVEAIKKYFEENLRQRLAGLVPMQSVVHLRNKIEILKLENKQLKLALEENKRLVHDERSTYQRMLNLNRLELSSRQRKFDKLKSEYDQLLDNQTKVRKELETYRTLLQQAEAQSAPQRSKEESKLHARAVVATACSSQQTVRIEAEQPVRVAKLYQSSHELKIVSHDPVHGERIVLENLTNRDQDISRFELIVASGNSEIRCLLPQNTVVKAGQQSRILSAHSSDVHSPPQSYKLKNLGFPTNKNLIGEAEAMTQIRDPAGIEIARIISKVLGKPEVNAIFSARFNQGQPGEPRSNDGKRESCRFM